MRPDMFKLIVERPRLVHGGGGNSDEPKGYHRRWARYGDEETPRFESNARSRRGGKWLNENLAPLRRFLHKQIGRPWNKVFSEICENISLDSAVQSHVRDHVEDFVAINVVMVDGRPRRAPHDYRGFPDPDGLRQELYVDPRTGLLRKTHKRPVPHRRRPQRAVNLVRDPRDPRAQFRKLDGVWYRVEFAVAERGKPVFDARLNKTVSPQGRQELQKVWGREDVYAAGMRPLSKDQVRTLEKRLGL